MTCIFAFHATHIMELFCKYYFHKKLFRTIKYYRQCFIISQHEILYENIHFFKHNIYIMNKIIFFCIFVTFYYIFVTSIYSLFLCLPNTISFPVSMIVPDRLFATTKKRSLYQTSFLVITTYILLL